MDVVQPALGDAALPPRVPITRTNLFLAFLKIGVLGFGGVAAWARHILVVERGWLSEVEFAELFGVSSTLPGANTVNLATLIGDRYVGVSGSVAALGGLIGAPLLILMGVSILYARYSGLPDVRAALGGAAAASAGLVMGTALKLLRNLSPDVVMVIVVAATFLASAFAQVPILITLVIAIPICVAAGIIRERRRR